MPRPSCLVPASSSPGCGTRKLNSFHWNFFNSKATISAALCASSDHSSSGGAASADADDFFSLFFFFSDSRSLSINLKIAALLAVDIINLARAFLPHP